MRLYKVAFVVCTLVAGGLCVFSVLMALMRIGDSPSSPGLLFVAHPTDPAQACVFVTDAPEARENGVYCRPRKP